MKTLISTFLYHVAVNIGLDKNQRKLINKFILHTQKIYDARVHALAEQIGAPTNLVEEYIYSLAKKQLERKKKGAEEAIPVDPSLKGFVTNIEKDTVGNNLFRKVLYTGHNSQLVLMSLKSKEDIGNEVHDVDQFFRIDAGSGKVVINDKEHSISNGSAFVVPAGAKHNVIAGEDGLKLYSIYSPPHHKDGTTHKTKEEALKDTEHFDGITTESGRKEAAITIDENKINRALPRMQRDTAAAPKVTFKNIKKLDPKILTEIRAYFNNPISLIGKTIKDLPVAIVLSGMAQANRNPGLSDVQRWARMTKIPVLQTGIKDNLVRQFPRFFE